MATNEINIGKGNATGMFYTATAGTAIPTTLDTIPSGWTQVGYINEDGMELELSKEKKNIKDWANVVRRIIITDHDEKASGKCMSTTAAALEEIFGADNVTESSGTLKVSLSSDELPPEKAFMFLMKDGDDLMCFGCSNGQISITDKATFKAGDTIVWPFEIVALGTGGMEFVKVAG